MLHYTCLEFLQESLVKQKTAKSCFSEESHKTWNLLQHHKLWWAYQLQKQHASNPNNTISVNITIKLWFEHLIKKCETMQYIYSIKYINM